MRKKNAKAEVIPHLPPYGNSAQNFPPEAFSEDVVVRFTKSDGSQWVGNFAGEDSEPSVIVHRIEPQAFVNAGGRGYIVDIDLESIIREIPGYISHIDTQELDSLTCVIYESKYACFDDAMNIHESDSHRLKISLTDSKGMVEK